MKYASQANNKAAECLGGLLYNFQPLGLSFPPCILAQPTDRVKMNEAKLGDNS